MSLADAQKKVKDFDTIAIILHIKKGESKYTLKILDHSHWYPNILTNSAKLIVPNEQMDGYIGHLRIDDVIRIRSANYKWEPIFYD